MANTERVSSLEEAMEESVEELSALLSMSDELAKRFSVTKKSPKKDKSSTKGKTK